MITSRVMKLGLVAILWLCLGQCQAQAPKHHVFSIQNVQLRSGERIVGLELHIVAGAFDSFDSLPVGWYITIDNDASWQTSVEANARVGAAALDMGSLRKIRVGILENEFNDLKFQVSGTVIVTTDFVNERRIELTANNFGPEKRSHP